MNQTTDTVLMIEPTRFGFNQEAALTNKFQKALAGFSIQEVQDIALLEFRNAVAQLREAGVEVITFPDVEDSVTPDSIFPNNWFSTHPEGLLITYPMAPRNRRAERREAIIQHLLNTYGYKQHLKLETYENEQPPRFLEGTGSLVLDRVNRVAYAARSPRTASEPIAHFCKSLNYKPVLFTAYGPSQEAIYHTNVMMCVGETFAAIGMDTVDEKDREQLVGSLLATGKEIIELSKEQTHYSFAGNMLQLHNQLGEKVLALSQTAYRSLSTKQLGQLREHNQHILPLPIHVIEKCGGGSVRCMLAEIFKV